VLTCDEAGIVPIVPKPLTSSGLKRGFFAKQDFVFDADRDLYVCPAGQKLTRGKYQSSRRRHHLLSSSDCLLDLPPQAALYAREASAYPALGA